MNEGAADVLDLDLALEHPGFALAVAARLPLQGITVIWGPSGSGKTTLLRAIAGLEPRAAGHVRLGRTEWQGPGGRVPPHRRRVGMVFQEPRLFPHLDVAQNLAYGARRAGQSAGAVAEVADALDLGQLLGRQVRGLSGGEARRVALGRALAMKPALLCLDEPLSGLDRPRRQELLPVILAAISRAGAPVLYVTHDAEEVAMLADRVLPLEAGRIAPGGLRPPPDCHDLRITGAEAGWLTVDFGGHALRLPGTGAVGSLARLRLPATALLLCTAPPPPSTARAILPGTVASLGPEGIVLAIGTRRLTLPPTPLPLAPGISVWVAALQADLLPRPRGAVLPNAPLDNAAAKTDLATNAPDPGARP